MISGENTGRMLPTPKVKDSSNDCKVFRFTPTVSDYVTEK
ncbi:predicted protein [Sclerotinia sclerotiorum 1980 UF-70]|uniref:Uncharacterized protein n=1 Tax=Sclerotinia sclerotiorum (strain ATCC 18683 / 1980 / Ss-1) TaxID=665079 RepID=A7F5L6_SCLS1|nr:predicted protein [Sclerotinia sclerotiorum 1980 UF-70]EDN98037.1 predicted protein [Sclerotinia sclerotiorum 1980 UF-70]